MIITPKQIALLKKYGFKWFKDQTTDTVEAEVIKNIVPAANGFTVIYTEVSALKFSTAKVEKIELPDNLEATWIFVHWESIKDKRNEAFVGA